MARTLVAGFGNELRGDDGFGIEVIHRLEAAGAGRAGVVLMEVGTGGLRLAQELLGGYERLIVVDAMTRGGAPGNLYLLEVESVEAAAEVDLHLAVPGRALAVAQALGALPREVFLVGCEPGEVEELTNELTPAVRLSVSQAVERVVALIGRPRADNESSEKGAVA